jgi:hypothetical protein
MILHSIIKLSFQFLKAEETPCQIGLKTAKNPPGWLVHTYCEDPGHNNRNVAGDEYYHVSMLQPEKVMRQYHDHLNLGMKYFRTFFYEINIHAPFFFTSTWDTIQNLYNFYIKDRNS